MRATAAALVAIAVLATACGRRDAPAPEQTDAPDANAAVDASAGKARAAAAAAKNAAAASAASTAALSKATASKSVAYTCEKDLPITAVYGTDLAGSPDVALIVQGRNFNLTQTVAASGARYATAEGLDPGMGLIWWEKAGTAMLQQVPSDKLADPAAAQTIKTCQAKS